MVDRDAQQGARKVPAACRISYCNVRHSNALHPQQAAYNRADIQRQVRAATLLA